MAETLLTIAQVSAKIRFKKSWIYAAWNAGTFPRPVKDGRSTLFVESEVDAWLAARTEQLIKERNMKNRLRGRNLASIATPPPPEPIEESKAAA